MSFQWRRDFVRTLIEQDLPQLGVSIPSRTLDRFWSMLAHYHAQVWNGSELARSFGVSHHVVRRYLEALESTFMVKSLKPWHSNLKKRQVKSPKIYIRDSGVLHYFLNINNTKELERHPKIGASWEGFIIENLIQILDVKPESCYFWATHSGAEIDLIVEQGGQLRGFEVKRTLSPKITTSIHSALKDIPLKRVDIIYLGTESFSLSQQVDAIAATRILRDM